MIDIIIPTKNSGHTLEDCLVALKKQKLNGKIIIVDGHSTDKTLEIAKKHGCETYFEPQTRNNRKSAEARNEGLKHSNSILVGFIDADTIVPENWLQDLVKYFKDPSVAGVSSGCVWKGGSDLSRAISKVIKLGSSHAKQFSKVQQVDSIATYNAIYFRGALDTVNEEKDKDRPQIFDESLGGCEDWELNYRLRKAGWKLLGVPESPVEHRERPTVKSFWRQMFHYAWARARVTKLKRNFSPLYALPSLALFELLGTWLLVPSLATLLVVLYLLGVGGLSLFYAEERIKLVALVFFVFVVFHLAWALGYVKGWIN